LPLGLTEAWGVPGPRSPFILASSSIDESPSGPAANASLLRSHPGRWNRRTAWLTLRGIFSASRFEKASASGVGCWL